VKRDNICLNIELVPYIFSSYTNLIMQNVIEEEAQIGSKDYLNSALHHRNK